MISLPPAEGQCADFKSKWTDDCLDDLGGFANADGGTLYIGVDDSGAALGIALSDKDLNKISNQITAAGLVARIAYDEATGAPGKRVLLIETSGSRTGPPAMSRGKFFVRQGTTTAPMTTMELVRRFTVGGGPRFMGLPVLPAIAVGVLAVLILMVITWLIASQARSSPRFGMIVSWWAATTIILAICGCGLYLASNERYWGWITERPDTPVSRAYMLVFLPHARVRWLLFGLCWLVLLLFVIDGIPEGRSIGAIP